MLWNLSMKFLTPSSTAFMSEKLYSPLECRSSVLFIISVKRMENFFKYVRLIRFPLRFSDHVSLVSTLFCLKYFHPHNCVLVFNTGTKKFWFIPFLSIKYLRDTWDCYHFPSIRAEGLCKIHPRKFCFLLCCYSHGREGAATVKCFRSSSQ